MMTWIRVCQRTAGNFTSPPTDLVGAVITTYGSPHHKTSERMPEGYWGKPINLGPTVNTLYSDHSPSISADGLKLFFNSDSPGGLDRDDIWQAPIIPIVDFNGDGIVDVQDLIVLAKYLFEEFPIAE